MSVSTQRNRPMINDPNIIPRVRKYLEEHVDQTYVDVGVMAKELQDKYSEYTRRKTVPFRILVEQAYKLVLRSYGLDSNPSSDNEDGSDADVELMEDNQGKSNNHMNDTMSSLYMNKSKTSAASNDGELIDISSDDDDGGDHAQAAEPVMAKANGTGPKDDQQQPRSGPAVVKLPAKPMEKVVQHAVSSGPLPGHNLEDISITPSPLSTGGKKAASPSEAQHLAKKRRTNEPTPQPTMSGSVTVIPVRGSTNVAAAQQSASQSAAAGVSKAKRFKKEVKCVNVSTTFEDIGGMDKTLTTLCELLVHVEHPEIYRTIGLPAPRGFLLHGPPGCGKSLLAHAIAGTLDIPLIKIPATELVAGVSGESEERIREVFEQAAALAPCVLFIDEIDVISSNRQNASKDMERRIVSQLIGSMDALGEHPGGGGVIVVGATSRPDTLDPALRRVGRFDHEICLGIPDRKARYQILHMICYDLKLEQPFDYDKLASLTPGYVGADLLALAQRAASTAIKRVFSQKQDQQAEQLYKRTQLLSKSAVNRLAAAIGGSGEVVNLTDDTLIMDVDDVEVTSTKEAEAETVAVVETPVQNGTPENQDTAMATVEPTPTVNEEPKEQVAAAEPEITDEQKITTTTEAEVNGSDSDLKLPEAVTATIPPVESMDTSENGVEKVIDEMVPVEKPADEVAPDEVTPTVETTPEPEANVTPEPIVEPTPEPTPELTPTPLAEEPAPLAPTTTAADDDTMVTEEPKTEEPPTVAAAATAPEKKVKQVLTLESMMQWLTNDSPVLTEDELKALYITMDDFVEALKHVQPSAKREGFITIPDVTWKDIGSLQEIRDELKLAVLAPVRFPDKLERLGLNSPSGVLLCGPPGCGKTLLAKAVANEAGINFISVKGPELLNMYVGESERAVRQVFQRARNSAPCVIFFDEFDALCPKRSDTSEGGGSQRVVNQLLTEMDGIEDRKGVFLMAATNRPDIVDPAVLRPGRLDKILYVGLPDTADRVDILVAITRNGTKPPLAPDVCFQELAEATTGFTGADLAGLMRQAALQSLKSAMSDVVDVDDDDEEALIVKKEHILEALSQVKPSVSEEDIKHYEKLKRKYGTTKKEKV